MRLAPGLALALWLVSLAPVRAAGDPPDPRRVLHLMHYVAKDYAEAAESKEADELAEQRGFLGEALRQLDRLPEKPDRARLRASLAAVLEMVAHVQPADQVGRRLEELSAEIARVYPAPRPAPRAVSLAAGRALYEKNCATCHGATGRADGPAAAEMKPRPIAFSDPEKMARLSPAHVHDTIAYGVTGTPMPSFESVLPADDRWDIAFYVFTLLPRKARDGTRAAR